ncbi:MAG: HlyD family efflux transporter periplasmic adaptor subunit [Halanaerobiales bacterium]
MKNKVYQLKNRRKNIKPVIKLILIISLILIIVLLVLYHIFFRTPQMVEVRHGEFYDSFSTRALIVRSEKAISSPVEGELKLLREEGERVHNGEKIVSLSARGEEMYVFNHRPGLISFNIDGLEELSPEQINELTPEKIKNLERNFRQRVDGDFIGAGQPLFRIVNTDSFFIVIETSCQEAERYEINEDVFLESDDLQNRVEGKIANKSFYSDSEKALLIVELKRFVDRWLSSRWARVEFVKNIHSGFVIPREAVFHQPEGRGVLIRETHGNFTFKPVTILQENQEEALVEGVEIGDTVIANPESVDYGRE